MRNRLVITKLNDRIVSAFFNDMEMVQVSIDKHKESGMLGNIYLGKVKNIVRNIIAFIEISNGKMCYYPINENLNPIMSNANTEDSNNSLKSMLKIGDELIVQVTKEGVKSRRQ